MSVMAVSPAVAIDGPLPRPPAFNLLDYAESIVGRWKGGVILWPFAGEASGIDPCLTGTFAEKDAAEEAGEPPEFTAFTAYVPIVCTTFGIPYSEIQRRAELALDAMVHAVAERQLVMAPYNDDPSLGDANVTDLNPAGAVALQAGLSHLENAIAGTEKLGWIHADPAVASGWSYQGALRVVGDRLETHLGTPVIVGHGYRGATANGTSAGTGNSWAFASGPVQAEVAPTYRLELAEALDRDSNTVSYLAERDLVVAWDQELQAAIRVDWTP